LLKASFKTKLSMPLLFQSTNGESPAVNLRDALLNGQAPDRGLYLPEHFPRLTSAEIAAFAGMPYHEIAFRVLSRYTSGIIPDGDLAAMCREAYDFNIPLEKIHDRVFLMRLDQGPTASFKDFAALMMARPESHHIDRHQRRHGCGCGPCFPQSSGRAGHCPFPDYRGQ